MRIRLQCRLDKCQVPGKVLCRIAHQLSYKVFEHEIYLFPLHFLAIRPPDLDHGLQLISQDCPDIERLGRLLPTSTPRIARVALLEPRAQWRAAIAHLVITRWSVTGIGRRLSDRLAG